MSKYGYAITGAKTLGTSRPPSTIRKARKMKLTLKQRFRNWLNDDRDQAEVIQEDVVSTANFDSDGMRLQIYKASGGYVVETRSYDRHKDRSNNSIHVITEDQDLGDSLGKIVMMEALRG